jgi:hypothetical protein
MERDTTDWSSLKSDWQSRSPIEDLASRALRGSLLWRIWASRAWFALEVLSFLFLGFAVLQNLLLGRVAQGLGLGVVVAFCLAASIWARGARLVGGMDSLTGMIELTLSRARKSMRIVYATYAVIGISLIAAAADALAPLSQDDRFLVRLVLLAICAGATAVYHFYVRARIRRFESIQRSFRARQP